VKDGKFHAARRLEMCAECGRIAPIQDGTDLCDWCLLDRQVGKLMSALEEATRDEDTVESEPAR